MKWCGSERRRLRPCVVLWSRRRRVWVTGPCRKARAGRYTPRRLLSCPRRPGPAPLCSGNERQSGAACSSPGVPNRRRRPWRSPGGCRRRPANGERARARLSSPGVTVRAGSAASRPDFRGFPRLAGAFGLGLPGEIGSRRAFSSLNVTRRVRSGFFFFFPFFFTTLLFGFSSLFEF